MIPGSNLLRMAMTIIAKQYVSYYRFAGRALNSVGQDVTQYYPAQSVWGSWQAVPRQLYMQLGLDLQKDYFTFYAPKNILDVGRDVSGDQIAFNGQRYQCESDNDWYAVDGWKGILCVHIGNDTGSTTAFGFGEHNQNFEHGNFIGDNE